MNEEKVEKLVDLICKLEYSILYHAVEDGSERRGFDDKEISTIMELALEIKFDNLLKLPAVLPQKDTSENDESDTWATTCRAIKSCITCKHLKNTGLRWQCASERGAGLIRCREWEMDDSIPCKKSG